MLKPVRRHPNRGDRGPLILPSDHRAMIRDEPLFPNMVRSALTVDRVLKSGANSRKLSSHWFCGDWSGMSIWSLSVPERSTCPFCPVRDRCYGNRMQIAPRFIVDSDLMAALQIETENLASMFPGGYSIRLHALGDFATRVYTEWWLNRVREVPALHLFGFTAHRRDSEIGSLIEAESKFWDRVRIRFSNGCGDRAATTTDDPQPRYPDGAFNCPATPMRPKIACGTCGQCIDKNQRVVFAIH